jgi:L-lactate dehydrogenase (cytochrome)
MIGRMDQEARMVEPVRDGRPISDEASSGIGRLRQAAIYRAGVYGRRPKIPTSWPGLEAKAQDVLSRRARAYVAGGAGLESTIHANADGFERWRIVPRVLHDVGHRYLTIELFGRVLPAPLLLGPVGVLSLAHRDADVAAARAAAAERVPMVLSNQASRSMEECVAVMGDSPRWFQLYWSTVDELVESFLARAEACRCDAIVVTLDTTLLGWRPRDLDLGSLPFAHGLGIAQYTSDPVFTRLVEQRARGGQREGRQQRPTAAALRALLSIARTYPGRTWSNLRSPLPRAAVETFLDIYSRPSITWRNLGWLRDRTRLPIVLKGILHPDDARRAVDHGVDGIIVSTHGGRQVDGGIGAIDALPEVVSAVAGALPVLFDSGVRSGADMVKALALGARAVLIGRPWVYGLALGGSEGVRDVVRNLLAEFDLTLGLAGCASVSDVGEITLVPAPPRG